jgi:hypothetical protein
MMTKTLERPVAEPGSGEALERAARRRKYAIVGGLAVAGFFPGFYLGYTENDELLRAGDTWPPELALVLATVYLVAVITGAVLLRRQTDEVALAQQYKATALAGSMFVLVYPLWYILWKGGLVIEPMHGVIYVLFLLTALGGMLYYRFR